MDFGLTKPTPGGHFTDIGDVSGTVSVFKFNVGSALQAHVGTNHIIVRLFDSIYSSYISLSFTETIGVTGMYYIR